MILVIGPNNSGKSAIAENLACGFHAPKLVYLATMVPANEDGRRRVANHQTSRLGLGFLTIESPLAESSSYADAVGADSTVLLEDVSNLLANLIFIAHDEDAVRTALVRIRGLETSSCHLIAVTIGGLHSEPGMDKDTCSYIADLDRLNSVLIQEAEQVVRTDEPSDSSSGLSGEGTGYVRNPGGT